MLGSSGVAFVHPRSINYPRVYHTFQARDLYSEKIIEYRIEDFPRDRFDEGVQYMIQNFFEHEVMGKSRRIKSDRTAVDEISRFWREILPKGFSIACFKENSNDIIAMNVMDIKSKSKSNDEDETAEEDHNEMRSKNLKDIFGVMSHAQKQFDVFDHYNVKEYLIAYGLCVDTSYRGRGIATEMLKARRSMLDTFNLKVTTTAFTGAGSQKAAAKAGYVENFVISYDDLYKINSDFYFPGIASTHFKTMSLTTFNK